jgi:hypothetical protein
MLGGIVVMARGYPNKSPALPPGASRLLFRGDAAGPDRGGKRLAVML